MQDMKYKEVRDITNKVTERGIMYRSNNRVHVTHSVISWKTNKAEYGECNEWIFVSKKNKPGETYLDAGRKYKRQNAAWYEINKDYDSDGEEEEEMDLVSGMAKKRDFIRAIAQEPDLYPKFRETVGEISFK